MFTIKFNDKELTVKALKTTISPLVGITNNLATKGRSVSKRVTSTDSNPKIITLEFPFERQINDGVSETVSQFFYSQKEEILINPKNENRYFRAKIDGDIDLKIEGTIAYYVVSLIVPDGISHSVKESTFQTADSKVQVVNNGTYKTPLSIHAKFNSDAKSIGFVSDDNIVQLGDTEVYETEVLPLSQLIANDDMVPASKILWRHNVGQPRRNRADGDNQSKVQGTMEWMANFVRASTFGPDLPANTTAYWHGPSESLYFGQSLENYGAKVWFNFYSTGSGKNKLGQKGLVEFNLYDSDNNAAMGFEICDNATDSNKIYFKFFVGDYQIITRDIPSKYWKDGFNGSLEMKKTGAKFYFRLAKITNGKEDYVFQKTYTNETIAGLKPDRLDFWAAKGANSSTLTMQLALTRIWKYNTVDSTNIPLTFLKGDELFVDGSTNYVYLNGVRADDYRIIGSDQLFIIEPGTEDITIVTDGELESASLTLEERFL